MNLTFCVGKEKESKRDEYLNVLHQHEISKEHQNLYLSTRSIGQKMSTKNQLGLLFNKHKAGIALNEDEMDLLFPQRHDNPLDSFTTATLPDDDCDDKMEVQYTTHKEEHNADLLKLNESSVSSTSKSLGVPTVSTSVTSGTDSIATKMLKHLEALKQTKSIPVNNSAATASDKISFDSQEDIPSTTGRYVPKLTVIPIGISGVTSIQQPHVVKTKEIGASAVGQGHIKVNRDSSIEANRMNLPVCGTYSFIVVLI
jgi:hypothetical protein